MGFGYSSQRIVEVAYFLGYYISLLNTNGKEVAIWKYI